MMIDVIKNLISFLLVSLCIVLLIVSITLIDIGIAYIVSLLVPKLPLEVTSILVALLSIGLLLCIFNLRKNSLSDAIASLPEAKPLSHHDTVKDTGSVEYDNKKSKDKRRKHGSKKDKIYSSP